MMRTVTFPSDAVTRGVVGTVTEAETFRGVATTPSDRDVLGAVGRAAGHRELGRAVEKVLGDIRGAVRWSPLNLELGGGAVAIRARAHVAWRAGPAVIPRRHRGGTGTGWRQELP